MFLVYLCVNEIKIFRLLWTSVAFNAQSSQGGIWQPLSLIGFRLPSATSGSCSLAVRQARPAGHSAARIEGPDRN